MSLVSWRSISATPRPSIASLPGNLEDFLVISLLLVYPGWCNGSGPVQGGEDGAGAHVKKARPIEIQAPGGGSAGGVGAAMYI